MGLREGPETGVSDTPGFFNILKGLQRLVTGAISAPQNHAHDAYGFCETSKIQIRFLPLSEWPVWSVFVVV